MAVSAPPSLAGPHIGPRDTQCTTGTGSKPGDSLRVVSVAVIQRGVRMQQRRTYMPTSVDSNTSAVLPSYHIERIAPAQPLGGVS